MAKHTVETRIVDQAPARAILESAEAIDADLIVLGSQHERFADASVIGATTERVVRFAKRAVWVVVRPGSS